MNNATTHPLNVDEAVEPAAEVGIKRAVGPTRRPIALGVMVTLLGIEAVLALVVTVLLSMLAAAEDVFGADGVNNLRFAAGATVAISITAYVAARKAWRGRGSAWTASAVVQLAIAMGISLAGVVGGWHPAMIVGLGLAAATILVQSTPLVRRALGQI